MVRHEGVQRVLRVGFGSAGLFGFAGAVWLRRTGRSSPKPECLSAGSNPTISGVLDAIQVQSKDDARAVALLEGWIEEVRGHHLGSLESSSD
jgi:hypothetical protein